MTTNIKWCLAKLGSYQETILAVIAVVAFYWAIPSRPSELEAIKLSHLDLLSSLKSGGVTASNSPLEIYWRNPLRPIDERGFKLESLTVSYIYLRNRGSQALEWDEEFDRAIEFTVDPPEVILQAKVGRWDEQPEDIGYRLEVDEGGRSCNFETPLVRSVDKIGLAILHTGPSEALNVVGRQKGHLPLSWSEGVAVRWTHEMTETSKDVASWAIAFLGPVWALVLVVAGNTGIVCRLFSGVGMAMLVSLGGMLVATLFVTLVPSVLAVGFVSWLILFIVGVCMTHALLIWLNAFSCRNAIMRFFEIVWREQSEQRA